MNANHAGSLSLQPSRALLVVGLIALLLAGRPQGTTAQTGVLFTVQGLVSHSVNTQPQLSQQSSSSNPYPTPAGTMVYIVTFPPVNAFRGSGGDATNPTVCAQAATAQGGQFTLSVPPQTGCGVTSKDPGGGCCNYYWVVVHGEIVGSFSVGGTYTDQPQTWGKKLDTHSLPAFTYRGLPDDSPLPNGPVPFGARFIGFAGYAPRLQLSNRAAWQPLPIGTQITVALAPAQGVTDSSGAGATCGSGQVVDNTGGYFVDVPLTSACTESGSMGGPSQGYLTVFANGVQGFQGHYSGIDPTTIYTIGASHDGTFVLQADAPPPLQASASMTESSSGNGQPLQGTVGMGDNGPSPLPSGASGGPQQPQPQPQPAPAGGGPQQPAQPQPEPAPPQPAPHHPLPTHVAVSGDPTFSNQVANCFDLFYATPGLQGLLTVLDTSAHSPQSGVTIKQILGTINEVMTHDSSLDQQPSADGSLRLIPPAPYATFSPTGWVNGPGASSVISIPSTVRVQDGKDYAASRALYPDIPAGSQDAYDPNGFCILLIHELAHAVDNLNGTNDPRIAFPYGTYSAAEANASRWENIFRMSRPPYSLRTTYTGQPLPPQDINPGQP